MSKSKTNVSSIDEEKGITPLMKQYNEIKSKYPDALLLFRVGDFYETFGQDAIKVSKILGIVLTKRNNGAAGTIELAGFPHHSVDTYLPKLVRAGNRVAICDQLEDPKQTKTIVKRGVTELVTPGVTYNEKTLDHNKNNFLCSVYFPKNFSDYKNSIAGISFLDVTTGEFFVAEGTENYLRNLIRIFNPTEIIFSKTQKSFVSSFISDNHYLYGIDDWVFTSEYTEEKLIKHFKTKSLKGFGIDEMYMAKIAAGCALHYIYETGGTKSEHIAAIKRIDENKFVWLDNFTVRNLELINAQSHQAKTLYSVLDNTKTPMGSRLLQKWLIMPLKEKKEIEQRLSQTEFFFKSTELCDESITYLKNCGDLERLISKVSTFKANPRDLIQLKNSLLEVNKLKIAIEKQDVILLLKPVLDQIHDCADLIRQIDKTLVEEAPISINKGNVVKQGISEELDQLRYILSNGKEYLLNIQKTETEKTGISSLKIGFNSVFGYYLEVTNTHKEKVPDGWIRKQTLTNAERYITEELKVYEEKILNAESNILQLEQQLYAELLNQIIPFIESIQTNAAIIAKIDCLICFASNARKYGYTKPEITENTILNIKSGRHPVIEQLMPENETYISNDVYLDTESQQIIMITGPNMSGKSAILRQTALIVIMAQCGSFVPASMASIGLVDKIFTRVGASDNLSMGESTFMVEMNETASILNNLTRSSLVLLDEIGRGTSTYDGISIAWAIAEFLHDSPSAGCRTLFATHYHELNDMSLSFQRIKNYNVSVKETENNVVFLRKLIPGGSEHSFGIHVAKMAGMPKTLVSRAEQILKELENSHSHKEDKKKRTKQMNDMQLSFFQLDDPVLSQIREQILNLDINSLTPVEALLKLNEIKKLL